MNPTKEEMQERLKEYGYVQLYSGAGFKVTLDSLGHLDRAIKQEAEDAKLYKRDAVSVPVRLEMIVMDYVTIMTEDVSWYVETDIDAEMRQSLIKTILEERYEDNEPHIPGVTGYD